MYNWQNNTSFITCKMVHVIKWLYYVNTCLFIQQDTCLNMDNRCHRKLLNDFCISSHTQKSLSVIILLRGSFSYTKWGVLIWFCLNPRNFSPRNFHFFRFQTNPFPSVALRDDNNIVRRGFFLRIFWPSLKVCVRKLTYSNAHANVKK